MSWSAVGNVGATALASCLHILTSLDLSHSRVSDAGAISLAAVLGDTHTSVYHLGLAHNALTDPSAVALARALALNCSLNSLDLSGNAITHVAVPCFGRALASNVTLRILQLDHNPGLTIEQIESVWSSCW